MRNHRIILDNVVVGPNNLLGCVNMEKGGLDLI